jgi:hypothetical protein
MLRTLETDAWIELYSACEDLPERPARASTSVRTHTNPSPTPTPDHIYRANFLRRLSHLVHVITNPEPALSAFAKHLARTTRVDPFPLAEVCEDDAGADETPPVVPEKAKAFIREPAAYENPKDPGAKAGMTVLGTHLHTEYTRLTDQASVVSRSTFETFSPVT